MEADNLPPFREERRSNLSAQGFYFLDAFLNFVMASWQRRGGIIGCFIKDGDLKKKKRTKCLHEVFTNSGECKMSARKKKKTLQESREELH